MRILALSTWWPEPADNGSRMRIMHLLRALCSRHEVHLIAFTQGPAGNAQRDELRRICASVTAIERPGRPLTLGDRVQSLFVAEPASVRATWSTAFTTAVEQTAAQIQPDLVLALQIDTAPYARRLAPAPLVLEELELGHIFEYYRHQRDPRLRLRYLLTALQHRRYVSALLRDFAAVTVVSAHEAALVRHLVGRQALDIAVIPNGADVAGSATYTYQPEPDTLIYPGALSYDANLDAARYFIAEILPLIRKERPNATLRITGRHTAEQRAALGAADGVAFTGYIDDIRALIARSAVEVVPLRQGGGTRLKILEALAVGTPVVSTSKGVEGLELEPGRHLLVGDTPQAFAAHTLDLLRNAELRARISADGRRAVAEHYDWQAIGARFVDFVEVIGSKSDYVQHAA
jgi:polysaccharide biosynthesis protein PslH